MTAIHDIRSSREKLAERRPRTDSTSLAAASSRREHRVARERERLDIPGDLEYRAPLVLSADIQTLAVLGGQWGDEGKGKLVDLLAERFDAVARYHGGHNAGHTVRFGDEHFALHLLPAGIF